MKAPDTDCMLYVDTPDREWLQGVLTDLLGGAAGPGGVLVVPGLQIHVAHNDYEGTGNGPSDFLDWPSVLECEAAPGASYHDAVEGIAKILKTLWSLNRRAVAACDFEELLPNPEHINGTQSEQADRPQRSRTGLTSP